MKRTTYILILSIALLILVAGFYYIFSGEITGEKFYIDYEKLETLANSHPNGEKLLSRVREREELLNDADSDNDAEAYQLIAFDVRQLGDDRMALSAYKEALKITPNNTLVWNNIATSYRDLGEYKKAEEAYRKILDISPGDVMAYRNLADVFIFQYPDDEEGLLEFMNFGINSALDPSDLLSYLAVYYKDRGNTGKAIEYFEKFLVINPSIVSAQYELKKLREQ